ncbi:MAG TPA: enoyl-CoA hydratase-related protein [Myxococcota bacterium]|jgi:enoyl-CoA hydratase/carnithine racemase
MGAAYQNILYEVADGIATITLNRPEKLNAYTLEMGEEVVDAFARIRADAGVRVAILTGAGRGFCAGVDLDALRAHQTEPAASGKPRLGEEDFVRVLPLELLEFPKPVIAAINGAAIGVGVTMTLPCDIRIAADTAKLGLTFARLGLLPGLGSTHLLPQLVGIAKALELVLTARVIPAAEAAEIGLVNRVVPAASLLDEARALARAMLESRPEVLAAAKTALRQGARASMSESIHHEREASAKLRAAPRR